MRKYPLSNWRLASLSLLAGLPLGAAAQLPDPEPTEQEKTLDTVVVNGDRIRGTTLSDVEPELVLNEEDIAAYGAGSLGELIELISAEVSSNRGRSPGPPVVLINGRRVSGFREVGRYPVEALARVEVLPEEVSLSYGFAAEQRVLNFVLKPNITVTTLTARASAPQQGDQFSGEASGQRLRVNGNTRISFDGEIRHSDQILEADRNVVFLAGETQAEFRTLAPEVLDWNLGFSAGREIWGGAVATLSGSYLNTQTEDLLGFAPVDERLLSQTRQTEDIFAGLSIASALAPTTWTFTANFNQVTFDTLTDLATLDPTEQDATLQRRTGAIDFVLNHRLTDLSAGPLALTATFGWRGEQQDTAIQTVNNLDTSEINRNTLSGRLDINVPISLPGPLPGDVTFNGNIDLRYLSDFGLLTIFGGGANWRLTDRFRILASYTEEDGAPTLNDIGAPEILTPNARIFDFQTGTDTFATLITGGNSDLIADTRQVYKVGLQWRPKDDPRIQFNVDYTRSRIENEVRTFRLLTDEFETAFPDRVIRDDTGLLLSFDSRPVQASISERDALRSVFSFSKRLKAKRARRRGPPPKKRRRSGRPGSLRFTAVHNWTLSDRVEIADGVPAFDFLNGASGIGLGGTSRHILDLNLNRWNNGLGVSASARYQSATAVDGPTGELSFSDLITANLQFSYEFNYNDRILEYFTFLEETRVSFRVSNLFNTRLQVTDEFDQTPLNFQDELLDPLGRTFRFELRRRF